MSEAPITPSPAQRREDFRRRQLPLLVWLVALVVVGSMLTYRATSHEFTGLAQVMQYRVSAPVAGKIEDVLVKELDDVRTGDIVARLDEEPLKARIQTALAAARQVAAELTVARAQLGSGAGPLVERYSNSLRRFRMDEAQSELNALALRVQVEGDQVALEKLALDAQRAEKLYAKGLISESELDTTRLSRKQIAQKVDHNRELLARTEDELRDAAQRRQEFQRSRDGDAGVEPALAPQEEAVKVQAARLEELRVEQRNLVLRAPTAGQISQVLCRRGQSVTPGEPIVVIAERIPTEILAYLPEAAVGRLRERSVVSVARRADPRHTAESVVTRVGASIEAIPQQLWRDPRVPEYGLPVVIAAVPALRLTPGEVVFVKTRGLR